MDDKKQTIVYFTFDNEDNIKTKDYINKPIYKDETQIGIIVGANPKDDKVIIRGIIWDV